MTLDLRGAILEALASPEGRALLREVVLAMPKEPANDTDRLLTAEEAADVLGMTPTAIRQAARRGTIPAVHVGRRVRFRLSDLKKSA